MNIGELARAADTKAETIRYYERIGLLPAPPRTAGNYRDYSAAHVSRLTFIRRARSLGFSIEQIGHCSILPTRKSGHAKPWTP
jgi:DNA-binding transcriptional MerR regulator